jgi:uncharacterized protein
MSLRATITGGFDMLFVVQFEDVCADYPERIPERTEHMAAHLAFLAKNSSRVVAAGALRPSVEGTPSGGIWILNVESMAAAEALYKDDPFWLAGLRKSVIVSHWAKAFWSPSFRDCMTAIGAT